MKKTLQYLFLIVLIHAYWIANAQQRIVEITYTLTGTTVDMVSLNAVPFITINLTETNSQKKLALASNENGKFTFTAVPKGIYLITFISPSYQTITKNIDLSSAEAKSIDLGQIKLTEQSTHVKEIVVSANRPLIKKEIDRISYNLQSDPESKGNSVLSMMRKIPYLSLDGEDNILLKGKQDYKVFINGRPSSMLERDYKAVLRNMPASSIERIEVITSPSSKYDADNVGGIINIITNKSLTNGYNGSINTNQRFPVGGPSIGGSLAMKLGKFGASVLTGGGYYNTPTSNNFKDLSGIHSPQILSQIGYNNSRGKDGYIGTEFSYEIDSLNLLSASLNINGSDSKIKNGNYSKLMNQTNILEQYDLNNLSLKDGNGWDAALNYQLGFKRNKNQILTFSYKQYQYNNHLNADQQISNRINYLNPNFAQLNKDGVEEKTIQLDYVQPLKKLNIEAGIKGIFRDNNSNYLYTFLNNTTHLYQEDPSRSNKYNNDQEIFSIYNSYQYRIKDWGFRAGIRIERTHIAANFISNATTLAKNYLNVPFTFNVNRNLNESSSVAMAFQQRIQRPGINKLNPFVDRSNPNFETAGNPNLQPALLNTLSLTYSYHKKFNFELSMDHNFSKNFYIPIATFDPINQITRSTFENIGDIKGLGLNIYTSFSINKFWNASINTGGEFIVAKTLVNNLLTSTNIFMYRGNLSTGYKLNKGWRLNGNVGYRSSTVTTLQGKRNATISSGFGVNKDIVSNKLSFSANINNPFNKYKENIVKTIDANFIQNNVSVDYSRSFSLSLNYKFGKLKESIKKSKRGIRNDDLSN